jgi:hypothetical protein
MKQVIWVALLALAGCAARSVSIPNSAVEGPLRAAQEVQDKYRSPLAELHSKYAREGLQVAKQLDEKGQVKQANLMRLRAQADAELAIAHARAAEIVGSNAELNP